MSNHGGRERVDGVKLADAPLVGKNGGAADHERRAEEAVHERELELADDAQDFAAEAQVFKFLCRGAPDHFDFEKVAQNSLGRVERKTAQEDGEHWNPLDTLPDWKEVSGLQAA